MTLTIECCAHLEQAEQRLAELAAAKRPHRLARINVLVGSGLARRYLQRRLARAQDGAPALGGVWFFTPVDLAQAAAYRSGERARTETPAGADAALLEHLLHEAGSAGKLDALDADQPGLADGMLSTLKELREAAISPAELRSFAAQHSWQSLADLARVYDRWVQRLGELGLRDRAETYREAIESGAAAWRGALGGAPLIVYGLYDLTRQQRLLILRAAQYTDTTMLVMAPSGDPDFAPARELAAQVAQQAAVQPRTLGAVGEAPPQERQPQTESFSAADQQAEAEEIARRVLDLAQEGIRFHQMAVFHKLGTHGDDRLAAALERADIPVYRANGFPVSETAAGRAALQLLELLWGEPTRSKLLELLANPALRRTLPGRVHRKPIFWERISRSAGMVRRWDQMSAALDNYLEGPELSDHERAAARDLQLAAAQLRERGQQARQYNSWAEASALLRSVLRGWLAWQGPRDGDEEDDDDPEDAPLAVRIQRALWWAVRPLERLDELQIPFRSSSYVHTVKLALENAAAPDRQPLTGGVFIGTAGGAGRLVRFDAVFTAGVAERIFPAVPRNDPLLTDEQRQALNQAVGDTALRRQLARPESDRIVFALLQQAARRRFVVSWARRSNAVGGPTRPSGLLLRAVGGEQGPALGPEELTAAGQILRLPVALSGATPSAETVQRGDWSAALRALDRADLSLALLNAPAVDAAALLPQLWGGYERAEAAQAGRAARQFTAYDGRARRSAAHGWTAEQEWTASALEDYAECPYRYFLKHILRLRSVPEPGEEIEISPLDRGTLIHKILENWVGGWLAAGNGRSWQEFTADPEPLRAAAEAELDLWDARDGLGTPPAAKSARQMILDDLQQQRIDIEQPHAAAGWQPWAAERSFEGAEVPLGDSRTIAMRGKMDRIDVAHDGRRLALDYKTGKNPGDVEQGFRRGRHMQMPLYLHAVTGIVHGAQNGASISSDRISSTRAEFRYITRRGGFSTAELSGEEFGHWENASPQSPAGVCSDTLQTIVDGVREGKFFPHPSDKPGETDHCKWCVFKPACTTDVGRRYARKRNSDGAHGLEWVRRHEQMRARNVSA